MAETAEQRDARAAFTTESLAAACRQEAGTMSSSGEAKTWSSGERTGFEIPLPAVAGRNAAAVVCTEPKDGEAFAVAVSRPDDPSRTREIALVRYDDLSGSGRAAASDRIDAAVRNALKGLRESLAGRQ